MEAIELYKEETVKMAEEGDGKQKVFIVCVRSRINTTTDVTPSQSQHNSLNNVRPCNRHQARENGRL